MARDTEKSRAFHMGFAIACVMLASDHGQDDYAKLLLDEVGITYDLLKGLGMDETDLEVVARIFA